MGALSTTLLAAVLLAQPGLAPETVVTVQRIGQDGVTYPLVGAEVAVETWKQVVGPGASRQLDAVRHVRTDLAGAARFVGVSSERTLESVATVVYDGVTYVSDPIAKAAVTMTVYESTGDQGALRGRMSVGLDVRDGFVIVDTSLALTNRSRQVIDTRRTPQGFRMPVALPAVLGGPVGDRGDPVGHRAASRLDAGDPGARALPVSRRGGVL